MVSKQSGKVGNPAVYGRLKRAAEEASHTRGLVPERIQMLDQAALLGHLRFLAPLVALPRVARSELQKRS
eukprot:6322504-Alexandrium_andersonii.AAC.1